MMIFLSATYLVIFSVNMFLLFFFKFRIRDILHPLYVGLFFLVSTIPYYYVVFYDSNFFNRRLLDSPLIIDFDYAVPVVSLLVSISFFAYMLGSRSYSTWLDSLLVKASSSRFLRIHDQAFKFFPWVIIYSLGVLILYFHVYAMGGVQYIWSNIGKRTELQEGLGYSMYFFEWFITLGVMGILYYGFSKGFFFRFFCFFVFLIGFVLLGLTGGRAPQLFLLWSCLFLIHFNYGKINFSVLVSLFFVFIFVLFVFSIVGVHRESYHHDEVGLDVESVKSEFFYTATQRLSDLDRNIAIVSYFNENDFWFGRSYLNLFYSPIPRNIYPDKPAISDGRYVRTLVDIGEVNPNDPSGKLVSSSWPARNWIGYMNFYIFGLFFLSFCSGFILTAIYRAAVRSNSFFFVALYSAHSWAGGIDFSVSGIVRMMMIFFILSFCFLFFYVFNRFYTDRIR